MLDYRAYGRDGEPEMIFVDQEDDYEITFLAENFEAFISGLVSEEEFDIRGGQGSGSLQSIPREISPLAGGALHSSNGSGID